MANLNLGQDVANKRERKQTAVHIVAISFPPIASCKDCAVTVLLLKSTPLIST